MKVEGFEPPQEEVILIRRSERTHRAPDHLCLNVEVEEHYLGDLNEPTIYKDAMLDSESNKRIDAMNAEIQSMIDNMQRVILNSTQMDVKTAFLNGYLDEDIYMVQPEGFVDPNHHRKVCKLQRSIYGLKQTSRRWNKRFDEEIKKFRFSQNLDEPCVYQKVSGSNVTFLILSKRLIRLGQNAYMDKILKRYKLDNSKRGHIPMQERLDLNKTKGALTPKEVKRMQNVPYALAVGSIIHWTTVKNILKYLRNTKDMFLVYGGNPKVELRVDCYCNAGFETNIDDMKSLTGYVFILKKGRRLEKAPIKYHARLLHS
ncbi:retrotransposon protein, putative, ty1-copia subclass [Tanacetum coccineum]